MKMKVKQEVRDLCQQFRSAEVGSPESKKLEDILKSKYKFTAFSLLALFENPSTIEYNDENFGLVMEN